MWSGEYIVEGFKLVKEAIQEKAIIKKVVICEEEIEKSSMNLNYLYEIAKYDCIYVNNTVFKYITDVLNPQGILAVVEKKSKTNQIDYNQDIIIVLDGIQDPGNIGTILRTVDSVGLNQIVLSDKYADIYNPKVVRSTMGAIFRVNAIESNELIETLNEIKKNNFEIVSTDLKTEHNIYDIDYKNIAIVIGNEANGVSEEILKISDTKMKIPMFGKTESLNASVATGIILYEYVRRKL